MRILLTGVSCVGKSTIGAELAASVGIPFFDLDTEVEAFFQTSVGRLQAQCRTMNAYRTKASRVLKALLSRTDAQDCVVALPPSGLMVPYWDVVKAFPATLVVVKDEPGNILNRIVFFDDESRPIHSELTPAEHKHYLDDIKKDMTYFARSYAKAHVSVHIEGFGPGEAAKKIKLALESLPELPPGDPAQFPRPEPARALSECLSQAAAREEPEFRSEDVLPPRP